MSATSQIQERGRQLVEEMAGVALQGRDLPALTAAVEEETSRLGLGDASRYLAHLEADGAAEERAALVDRVVNNETYFFREPLHFQALTDLLVGGDDGAALPVDHRLRVLSAGCATGEEAYSLAAVLLELRPRRPDLEFEVLGVDVSRRALDVARGGVYGPHSFRRAAGETRLASHLEPLGDGAFAVAESLRSHVSFHRLNLMESGAVRAALGAVDIIFFRNVLIYLAEAARREVCDTLTALLRRPGLLFLGTSESLPAGPGELRRQVCGGIPYWTRDPSGERAPSPDQPPAERRVAVTAPGVAAPAMAAAPGAISERGARVATGAPSPASAAKGRALEVAAAGPVGDDAERCMEAVTHARDDRADEALTILRAIVATTPEHPEACRLMAELHLDRTEFAEARRLSERATDRDETLAWPYVLRGRVEYNAGDGAAATEELRKAIYYRPDWWPAHFYLAEAYRARGERALARRAYANALRNLERVAGDERLCEAEIIGCTRDDVAATCRANLLERQGRDRGPRA